MLLHPAVEHAAELERLRVEAERARLEGSAPQPPCRTVRRLYPCAIAAAALSLLLVLWVALPLQRAQPCFCFDVCTSAGAAEYWRATRALTADSPRPAWQGGAAGSAERGLRGPPNRDGGGAAKTRPLRAAPSAAL